VNEATFVINVGAVNHLSELLFSLPHDQTGSIGPKFRFLGEKRVFLANGVGIATQAQFVASFGHDEALMPLKMARTGSLEAEPGHLVCR
jgi:hypothetical protein